MAVIPILRVPSLITPSRTVRPRDNWTTQRGRDASRHERPSAPQTAKQNQPSQTVTKISTRQFHAAPRSQDQTVQKFKGFLDSCKHAQKGQQSRDEYNRRDATSMRSAPKGVRPLPGQSVPPLAIALSVFSSLNASASSASFLRVLHDELGNSHTMVQ